MGLKYTLVADDEFADFQAAPTSAPVMAPAKPNLKEMLQSGPKVSHTPHQSMAAPNNNLFGMLASTTQPTYTNQNQTSLFGGATSPPMRPTTMSPPVRTGSTPATAPTTGASKPKPSSNFDDLWSMSLGSSPSNNKSAATGTGANKSIKDLEKEKAQAGIWGSGPQSQQQQQRPGGMAMGGSGFGQFGGTSFSGSGAVSSSSASAGGGDDLLL